MIRAALLLLMGALGAPPAPDPSPTAPDAALIIEIQVLEDAWRVGDEKTYTLQFDRAPFGRQALKLVGIRPLAGGGVEATFQQRIHLDLRALGQEGSLEQAGRLVLERGASGPYRYREARLEGNGYDTYRSPRDYAGSLEAELDPASGTFRVTVADGDETEGRLPGGPGATLVDLLAVVHWEHVLSSRRTWRAGETVEVPLLVPGPLPRLDFHHPVDAPRPVEPQLLPVRIRIEAREEVELFGAQLPAFRCVVSPGGWTLWVSPLGGLLRFEDGRGLAGSLEP